MGDSVEDLLAQIKAQYADTTQPEAPQPGAASSQPAPAPQPPQSPQPAAADSSSGSSSGSIDDLLAEIEGKPAPAQQPQRLQPFPSVTQTDWQQVSPAQSERPEAIGETKSATDRLLEDLRTQYDQHDRAEELKRQQQQRAEELKQQEQIRQEQRRQAELKRHKQLAVMQQAEEWLKRLDPRSGEAAWFEEFAAKYESKLEAAIDYLGLDQ